MKKTFFALIAALVLPSTGAVVINEIRIDDNSTDTDEYFELKGTPGESLSGLSYIVIGDGTGVSGVIERVISLDGLTIGASGYFLAANSGLGTDVSFSGTIDLQLVANAFENGDNVTHLLVSGFNGASGNDLDTNNDGTLDTTPWTTVVDAVSLVVSPDASTSEHFYAGTLGFTDIGPDGTFVPGHVFRVEDGSEWGIGPFSGTTSDTPGAVNVPEPAMALLGSLGVLGLLRRRR